MLIKELEPYEVGLSELIEYLKEEGFNIRDFFGKDIKYQYTVVCEFLRKKYNIVIIMTSHNFIVYDDLFIRNKLWETNKPQCFEMLAEGIINYNEYKTGVAYEKTLCKAFEWLQNYNF